MKWLKAAGRNLHTRLIKQRRGTSIAAHDERLWQLIAPDAKIERITTGCRFTEGPVWLKEQGALLFSDIPSDRIHCFQNGRTSIFRAPSGMSNGLTLDLQGRLIACEHRTRRVTRTESDGNVTVIADTYNGRLLNSPNDVVVKSDGSIYFTDPPYGIRPDQQEQPHQGVYRLTPDGMLTLLVADFVGPNGLAFSPDETRLYIGDSKVRFLKVYDVEADGTLTNGRFFYDMNIPKPGNPDGMKLDESGHLFVTGPGGVWVFTPEAEHLGMIVLPEIPANCAWGDDGYSLYFTAQTSVYRVRLLTKGRLL
jgi:gluconolactonase